MIFLPDGMRDSKWIENRCIRSLWRFQTELGCTRKAKGRVLLWG